ncbi:MAG: hypothetical protein E2576_11085 [Alcaligenaceae bacterium]|nr:hypothetical protein [Alcaligenaceae bacterium SAGV5]MPS51248.1 hypothetical protein [Alcaligenaceae bacterium SAGV3]MPT57255.1 hypothetical protein [Alcaligenaceae bacterium]
MNVTDALYHAVHDYPGGAEALAVRMGISASSLQHKVNPRYPTAHCSPEEMVEIVELTGDTGPLIAIAHRLRAVVTFLPALADECDDGLMSRTAEACREFGELIAEVGEAVADGRVTDNELRRVEAGITDLHKAMHGLHAMLVGINERGKPTTLHRAA